MTETVTPPITQETNKLVEKIGKDNVRRIAALGLAAAGLLGISGKLDSGVGVGIEVPNPVTGEQVSVGVTGSSTEGEFPLGIPSAIVDKIAFGRPNDLKIYQVNIGGVKLAVYTATLENKNGDYVKTVGIYPGFETALGK